MQDKISIVMPVKNPGPFLTPCLQSITKQSYENWELICVNDHSTDDSLATMQSFTSDPRIKVLNNKGSGIVDALRMAYKASTGVFIHRMDSDDIMPSKKLELMLKYYEKGSVVTGMVQYFSDEWEIGDGFVKYQNWLNDLMTAKNFWKDRYVECPIPSPAWLMARNDFERIGGFESDGMPEDYDLCFRIFKHQLPIRCVQETIHLWRDSSGRSSRNMDVYFPMSYFQLKVKYFLELDRDNDRILVLSGAGKKGKRIAELLNSVGQDFLWITNNPKKIGQQIYGKVVQDWQKVDLRGKQVIFAVSAPESKSEIRKELQKRELFNDLNHFWFC